MKEFFKYLMYLIKHKYYVFKYGKMLKVPLFQLLIHDWSKFLPTEFFPYKDYFYGPKENKEKAKGKFDSAWLHHIHMNPHHWEHFLLCKYSKETVALKMPENYWREMVADWLAAGKVIKGKIGIKEWYDKNKNRISLHYETRKEVEAVLDSLGEVQ